MTSSADELIKCIEARLHTHSSVQRVECIRLLADANITADEGLIEHNDGGCHYFTLPTGEKHGRCTWFEQSRKVKEAHYQHGKLAGRMRLWSATGTLVHVSHWDEDLKHGVEMNHYTATSLSDYCEWQHGQKHGVEETFNSEAVLLSSTPWHNNKRDGLETRWNNAGQKIYEAQWHDDVQQGWEKDFDPEEGWLCRFCEVTRGRKHGMEMTYNADELVMSATLWTDGKMNGRRIVWDNHHRKTHEGKWVHGKLHGVTTNWREGRVIERRSYENDVFHGPVEFFDFKTGRCTSRQHYRRGKLHGPTEIYTADGVRTMYAFYLDDHKVWTDQE